MPSLFITGSDTNVGKTIVTTMLAKYLLRRGVGIYKPVQSGTGDREHYLDNLAISQTADEICPQYFHAPLAVPLAAEKEGKTVDLGLLWQNYQSLLAKYPIVLVEGAGGIGSPITWEYTSADLARDWRMPTVLVVPVKLGSMTQTITSCALARERGVDLRGIIFNCTQPHTDNEIEDFVAPDRLSFLAQAPILGFIPHLTDYSRPITDWLDLAPLGLD